MSIINVVNGSNIALAIISLAHERIATLESVVRVPWTHLSTGLVKLSFCLGQRNNAACSTQRQTMKL